MCRHLCYRGTISTEDARKAIEKANIGTRGGQRVCSVRNTLSFFIRTSNFGAEVERSYCFW